MFFGPAQDFLWGSAFALNFLQKGALAPQGQHIGGAGRSG
jgi:hypothetical protein